MALFGRTQTPYGEQVTFEPLKRLGETRVGQMLAQPVKGFGRTLLEVPQSLGGWVREYGETVRKPDQIVRDLVKPELSAMPYYRIFNAAKDFYLNKTGIDEDIAQLGKDIVKGNEVWINEKYPDLGPPEEGGIKGFLYNLGSGAGTLAAALGIYALTRSPHASAAMFGAYQKGNLYNLLREENVDVEKASQLSSIGGITEGALEYVGLKWLLQKIPKGALWSIGKKAFGEATQEFLQTTGENVVVKLGGVKRKVFEGAAQAALLGALLGGGSSVALDFAEKTGLMKQLTDSGVQRPEEFLANLIEKNKYRLTDVIRSEAGFARISKGGKISPAILENLKKVIDNGNPVNEAITTVLAGTDITEKKLLKAYKKKYGVNLVKETAQLEPKKKPRKKPRKIDLLKEIKKTDVGTPEWEAMRNRMETDFEEGLITPKNIADLRDKMLDKEEATLPPPKVVEQPVQPSQEAKTPIQKQVIDLTKPVGKRVGRPVELFTWLRQRGGINIATTDLKGELLPLKESKHRSLIKMRTGGTSLDILAQYAYDAGYTQGPNEVDLVNAINERLSTGEKFVEGQVEEYEAEKVRAKRKRLAERAKQRAIQKEKVAQAHKKALEVLDKELQVLKRQALKERLDTLLERLEQQPRALRKPIKELAQHHYYKFFWDDISKGSEKEAWSKVQFYKSLLKEDISNVKKNAIRDVLARDPYKKWDVITYETQDKLNRITTALVKRGVFREANFAQFAEDNGIDFERLQEEQTKGFIKKLVTQAELIKHEGDLVLLNESLGEVGDELIHDAKGSLKDVTRKIINKIKKNSGDNLKERRINPRLSMRYYIQNMERMSGGLVPYHDFWIEKLLMPSQDIEYLIHQRHVQIQDVVGKDEYNRIVQDEKALQRIEAYMLAESALEDKPDVPTDITESEILVAKEMQKILEEFIPIVKWIRFREWYKEGRPIPNAPPEILDEAATIYEESGGDQVEVMKFLDQHDIGVIKSGYTPLSVLKPKIVDKHREYRAPLAFGSSHITSRKDLRFRPQEKNVLRRLNTYMRQMYNLYHLEPAVQHFAHMFEKNVDKIPNAKLTGEALGSHIDALKGYYPDPGQGWEWINRLYSTVSASLILPDPAKWLRNKFQNPAFYPHHEDFLNPKNRVLNEEEMEYMRKYVFQTRPILEHYLMSGETPFKGTRTLVRLAQKYSLYPWTDQTNRMESFWAKLNAVERAVHSYAKHGDLRRFAREARLYDLEPLQQRRALALLKKGDVEGVKRYVAQEVTFNVHFAYDWALRSPAELSQRVLANLMAFPRGYAERLIKEGNKLAEARTWSEARGPINNLARALFLGTLVGALFAKLTGKRRNPYNPLEILNWTPGGVMLEAPEKIMETVGNLTELLKTGDVSKLDKLLIGLSEAGDFFIPFYMEGMNVLESVMGMKNIDKYAYRKYVKEPLTKRYRVRLKDYKVRRNIMEAWTHALWGGKPVQLREEKKRRKRSKVRWIWEGKRRSRKKTRRLALPERI